MTTGRPCGTPLFNSSTDCVTSLMVRTRMPHIVPKTTAHGRIWRRSTARYLSLQNYLVCPASFRSIWHICKARGILQARCQSAVSPWSGCSQLCSGFVPKSFPYKGRTAELSGGSARQQLGVQIDHKGRQRDWCIALSAHQHTAVLLQCLKWTGQHYERCENRLITTAIQKSSRFCARTCRAS